MKDAKTIHEEGHRVCICNPEETWEDGERVAHHGLVAGCPATHGYANCPECNRTPWTPIVGLVDGRLEKRCTVCLAEDTEVTL